MVVTALGILVALVTAVVDVGAAVFAAGSKARHWFGGGCSWDAVSLGCRSSRGSTGVCCSLLSVLGLVLLAWHRSIPSTSPWYAHNSWSYAPC